MLLDWELADDITGLDVMRAVRPQIVQKMPDVSIVIVSGNERSTLEPPESEELTALGVSDWWLKPATADKIAALLAQHQQRRQ